MSVVSKAVHRPASLPVHGSTPLWQKMLSLYLSVAVATMAIALANLFIAVTVLAFFTAVANRVYSCWGGDAINQHHL